MQQCIETFGKINGNEVYENRDCKIMTIFIFQHREWQEFPEAFFMAGSVNRTEGEGALLPRHVEWILV